MWLPFRFRRVVRPALLALLLSAGSASAHPHVFIDYTVTVLFDDNAAQAVRVSWTFDEMYSSMLLHDYTSRPPRDALTPADVKSLRKQAFEDTADYHYFVDLKLNGATLPVKEVTDFDARFHDHRMTYAFTLPLRASASQARNTLEIDAFDNEFYIDFELAEKHGVMVEHGEKLGASCAPRQQSRDTTMVGSVSSIVVACTYGAAAG
ncbi:MAG TPA: DUF1007 family protein [Stellaceae bacterium]|nr:DUF1007 family protein [Stellaceae bacterium]